MYNPPSTDLLNDELRFLIACCQTAQSDEDINFIYDYLSLLTHHSSLLALYPKGTSSASCLTANADSSVVKTKVGCITTALQHGILPLVYKTLKKLSKHHDLNAQRFTPYAEILTELKAHYMGISQRNMLMSAELIRIIKLLEDNGIEALAFKGPVLSQMAYGDITFRQYSDLDILVDEKEISQAGTILDKHGYHSSFPIKILENKTCLDVTNDLAFYNESNGILIELHWKLFREKIGQHLQFLHMNENKQTIKINGRSIPTLSTEMLLAYLCLHGSKHAWERIEWICDIDRLIRSNQDLDWAQVENIARDMDTLTPLYLGLKLSHILFNTPLPEAIIQISGTKRIEDLILKTFVLLNGDILQTENYSRYRAIHHYQMDLLDTKLKKLRHLYTTYLGISKNDCESFPLPSQLKFLYIFIKPFRVAIKYIQYGK